MKKKSLDISVLILIINIILIFVSMISSSNMFLTYVFYLIFAFLIFNLYGKNIRRYLYFTTLFYAVITSGNSKYVFLFFFLYISYLIYTYTLNSKKKSTNNIKKYINKYFIFFFVFVMYVVLSIFITNNKVLALEKLYRYIIMFSLFAMCFIENNNREKLQESMKFLLYVFLGILSVGTLEIFGVEFNLGNVFVTNNITYEYVKRIPVTFFYNPNNYAVVLDIAIAAIFSYTLSLDTFTKRIKYYFVLTIAIVNLIFTRSRIGWLVLFLIFFIIFIGGIILLFQDRKIGKRYIIKSLLGFLASIFIFASLSIFPFMEPYFGKLADTIIVHQIKDNLFGSSQPTDVQEPIQLEFGGEGSENERVTLIVDVLEGVIKEKNYFGFGVGNIGEYVIQKNNTFGLANIHSFWFEILGDFGLPIFVYTIVIYCIMLWDTFIVTINNIKDKNPIPTEILVIEFILVILAFSPSTVLMFSPFWIMLGICFSFAHNYKKGI